MENVWNTRFHFKRDVAMYEMKRKAGVQHPEHHTQVYLTSVKHMYLDEKGRTQASYGLR